MVSGRDEAVHRARCARPGCPYLAHSSRSDDFSGHCCRRCLWEGAESHGYCCEQHTPTQRNSSRPDGAQFRRGQPPSWEAAGPSAEAESRLAHSGPRDVLLASEHQDCGSAGSTCVLPVGRLPLDSGRSILCIVYDSAWAIHKAAATSLRQEAVQHSKGVELLELQQDKDHDEEVEAAIRSYYPHLVEGKVRTYFTLIRVIEGQCKGMQALGAYGRKKERLLAASLALAVTIAEAYPSHRWSPAAGILVAEILAAVAPRQDEAWGDDASSSKARVTNRKRPPPQTPLPNCKQRAYSLGSSSKAARQETHADAAAEEDAEEEDRDRYSAYGWDKRQAEHGREGESAGSAEEEQDWDSSENQGRWRHTEIRELQEENLGLKEKNSRYEEVIRGLEKKLGAAASARPSLQPKAPSGPPPKKVVGQYTSQITVDNADLAPDAVQKLRQTSLEDILEEISPELRQEAQILDSMPVPVWKVGYTSKIIKDRFDDGRPLTAAPPPVTPSGALYWPDDDRFYSWDNEVLYSTKKYQEAVSEDVMIVLKVYNLSGMPLPMDTFSRPNNRQSRGLRSSEWKRW